MRGKMHNCMNNSLDGISSHLHLGDTACDLENICPSASLDKYHESCAWILTVISCCGLKDLTRHISLLTLHNLSFINKQHFCRTLTMYWCNVVQKGVPKRLFWICQFYWTRAAYSCVEPPQKKIKKISHHFLVFHCTNDGEITQKFDFWEVLLT